MQRLASIAAAVCLLTVNVKAEVGKGLTFTSASQAVASTSSPVYAWGVFLISVPFGDSSAVYKETKVALSVPMQHLVMVQMELWLARL